MEWPQWQAAWRARYLILTSSSGGLKEKRLIAGKRYEYATCHAQAHFSWRVGIICHRRSASLPNFICMSSYTPSRHFARLYLVHTVRLLGQVKRSTASIRLLLPGEHCFRTHSYSACRTTLHLIDSTPSSLFLYLSRLIHLHTRSLDVGNISIVEPVRTEYRLYDDRCSNP